MMHGKKCCTGKLVWLLVLIGALNWGLVGVGGFFDSNWNLVNLLLGNWSWAEYIVYILIGLSGVSKLFGGCRCKKCRAGNGKMDMAHEGGAM